MTEYKCPNCKRKIKRINIRGSVSINTTSYNSLVFECPECGEEIDAKELLFNEEISLQIRKMFSMYILSSENIFTFVSDGTTRYMRIEGVDFEAVRDLLADYRIDHEEDYKEKGIWDFRDYLKSHGVKVAEIIELQSMEF